MTASPTISFYLLRGLTREIRHWGDFTSLLENAKNNYQVIPLEIPGTGSLRKQKAPMRIAEYVREIRPQYHRHAITKNYNIIIGMSFGGMIAAEWTAHYPDDLQATVLINTSCRDSKILKRISFSGAMQLAGTVFSSNNYRKEKRIAELICNMADTNKVAKEWAYIRKSSPVPVMQSLRQLYSAANFSLPRNIRVPVLLLTSKKDRMVSPSCTEDISIKTQSTLIYHSHAGHDLPTDDPQWCVNTIKNWVEEHIHKISKI